MNENEKNIETCLAESVLAEVANVPTDAQFRSLVDEALDPLQQQALQQAGWEAYEKVVWTHQPYTFVSSVRQMKSNLILLLRRLWRFPFGRGTSLSAAASSLSDAAPLRSLADMWSHYITRLSGNSEYGIPSRLSSLTDLPSAPLLLSDRKISGVPEAPDGISLVQLTCSDLRSQITELKDDTTGWTYSRNSLAQFPNAKKVTLGCKTATVNIVNNNSVIEELNIEELETLPSGYNRMYYFNALTALKHFYAPKLKTFTSGQSTNLSGLTACEWISMPEWTGYVNVHVATYLSNNPVLKWIYIPKCGSLNGFHKNHTGGFCCSNDILEKVTMGTITAFTYSYGTAEHCAFYLCPRLIDLEIGADTAVSLYIAGWNPSYVLSDNPTGTDLIEEGSTAQNNLQQFLQNFRDYIAERLQGGYPIGQGPTLTLSQAVFSSIWDANGNPQVLGDGLDQLRADIHRIIRTEKHWNVNKA